MLLLFSTALIAGYMAQSVPKEEAARTHRIADVTATRFLAYRSAVLEFVRLNPSTPDGGIGFAEVEPFLPLGYVGTPSDWGAVREGQKLFVYTPAAVPAEAMDIVFAKMNRSMLVGHASGGQLRSPSGLNTGIVVPPSIPDGAIVIVGG